MTFKLKQLQALAEGIVPNETIYIEMTGTWEDEDGGDIDGFAVYAITVPASDAKHIVDELSKDAVQAEINDNAIDDFEQDFAPDEAISHAQHISIIDVGTKKPGRAAGKVIKNGYKMVYVLRDLGLLEPEHAEKIASTKY